MNERITELAEQATIRVNNPTVNSNGEVICDNWEEGVSLSKFAQLIAQHCMNIANKEALAIQELDDGRPTFFAGITAASRIGRQIGIEFDLFGESK